MKTRVVRLLSVLMVVAVLLSACAQPTPTPVPTKPGADKAPAAAQPTAAPAATKAPEPTKAPAPTAAPASKYKEAPMLADLVKAGKLPAVDQRLPQNPLVYAGASVGTYGGNWRMGMRAATIT